MPLQRIETVDEPRARTEAQGGLFDTQKAHLDDFRNMLIWGDNKLVVASLLKEFRGKIDLIYIDPPFDVGADFTLNVAIGDRKEQILKDQSTLEMVAYRDTWGRGTDSYLFMMYERIALMREFLVDSGSLYVHAGPQIGPYLKVLLDDVFGKDRCVSEIVWKRTSSHNDPKRYGVIHDYLFYYAKSEARTWNEQFQDLDPSYLEKVYVYEDERGRYRLGDLTAPGVSKGMTGVPWRGVSPTDFGRHWRRPPNELEQLLAEGRIQLKKDGKPSINGWKQYLGDSAGVSPNSIWSDIPNVTGISSEKHGYATQKPELLLERIIKTSSHEADLVADFFCGSGTTGDFHPMLDGTSPRPAARSNTSRKIRLAFRWAVPMRCEVPVYLKQTGIGHHEHGPLDGA